jgi:two-component system chemotaxis sensor kinase CheA
VIKESSVRVPVERLDRFIDMVGELVVAHSMVVQDETVAAGGHHELTKKVGQTTKIVRELQRMSMSMRMIPLKGTFQKMARLVRDLARKAGKNVSFLTEGEDTEIDRNMVDIINDPLVHMVRNAVDHGIEPPGDRERTGKPVNGVVQLSAYHSAGNVVVEIRDDGRGLDREAILSKALERGLITTIDGLSDEEVYGLIFQPGFSTARTVSEVSGRGVGMDVVKTNIESLRGQVEVKSWPGQGSVVKMSLPLTLAIIDGMVIRVGTQKFVIPTVSIVRSVQPAETELSRVFQRGEMLSLQGKLIPLFRLASLFDIEDAATDPTQAIVVVVEDDRRQTGLLVDELIGSQQIVIKTLGEALGNIPGISGSAIMPNGRVGLILDVGGLVRLANDFNPEKQAPDEFSQSDVSGADRETV